MTIRFADELTKLFDATLASDLQALPPKLVLARGDFASFQIAVFCDSACEGEICFPEGFELWREHFAEIGDGLRVAEALFPRGVFRGRERFLGAREHECGR